MIEIVWILKLVVMIVMFIYVSYTDLKRMEIDNEPLMIALTLGFIINMSTFSFEIILSSMEGFVLGAIIFSLLALWSFGGGDVKLMAVTGFFLGWKLLLINIVIMFGIAGVSALVYGIYIQNRKAMFPLAPFISISTILTYVFGDYLIYHTSLFWYLN